MVTGAAVMAVAASAAVATVVDAAPAPPTPESTLAAESTETESVPSVPLPAVTLHAIDPALVQAAQPNVQQSVAEVIQLSVIGGPLELVTSEATVTLERVSGSDRDWTAALPPVRVIDARGTHDGWAVSWTVSAVDGVQVNRAKVKLEPGAPAVVAGTPDGLAAGKGGPAVRKGRILFNALSGSGGGTYEAGGTVSLRLPGNLDAESVVVHLAFTIA
jgi:hypothetical protein